jgi:signal transduction histidine kinase
VENELANPADGERLVEELRRTVAELSQANRLKSEFLQTVSHELRTPLTAIRGFVDLLLLEVRDADQVEQLHYVKKNAEKLQSLVSDLLEMAAVQAGRSAAMLLPLDLAEVVAATGESFRAEAERKGLELEMSRPAGPMFVMAEKYRTRTLLQHLMSNAVKFTASGTIRVSCSRYGSDVRVEVKDTGVGIPEEHLAAIFDPFHQVETGMTRAYGGTGVGLALTRELVELQGGHIGVDSRVGSGSTFWFTLPALEPQATA